MFGGQNLLELPENQLSFRQLLGLEAHTPFECVGGVPEARLAFELCCRKVYPILRFRSICSPRACVGLRWRRTSAK